MAVELMRTLPEGGATNVNHVVRFRFWLSQPVVVCAPVAGGTTATSVGSTVAPVLLKIYGCPSTGISAALHIMSLVIGIMTETGPIK